MLAMLGWNPGVEQEIFFARRVGEYVLYTKVHKGGAKFDFEKAKRYNQQYIQRTDDAALAALAMPYIEEGLKNTDSQTDDLRLTDLLTTFKKS